MKTYTEDKERFVNRIMKAKDKERFVKATVVLDVEFYMDKDTCPEDVFGDLLCTTDTHGFVTKSQLVHTAITMNKKNKKPY